MNFQKFTRKSIEAVNSAQSIATEHGNQELKQLHLLLALLKQEDGLIGGLFGKMVPDVNSVLKSVQNAVNTLPKVSGGQLYVSGELSSLFAEAEKQADYMKDSFVSVEHLILAMFEVPAEEIKRIFKGRELS